MHHIPKQGLTELLAHLPCPRHGLDFLLPDMKWGSVWKVIASAEEGFVVNALTIRSESPKSGLLPVGCRSEVGRLAEEFLVQTFTRSACGQALGPSADAVKVFCKTRPDFKAYCSARHCIDKQYARLPTLLRRESLIKRYDLFAEAHIISDSRLSGNTLVALAWLKKDRRRRRRFYIFSSHTWLM